MPEIAVTTVGSAILGASMFATSLVWKFAPTRKARVGNVETDLALLANELSHVKDDVAEIKKDVKSIQSKLR